MSKLQKKAAGVITGDSHDIYPGARGYLFSPGLNIPSGEIGVVFRFTFHT
jgi:hypothetical protein